MVELDDCINRVKHLSPAPAVLPELLNCLSETSVESSRIARLITFDPALTASVLHLCNSPYFASATRVVDLNEAVLRLGLEQVFRLIAVVTVSQTIRCSGKNRGAEDNRLWKHSVAAAVASKLIAHDSGDDQNLVFTAALLHDIGKLILIEAFDDAYTNLIGEVEHHLYSLLEAEKRVLGVEHAEVGGRLLARWKFPLNIATTVCFHHQPASAQPYQRLAACVHLGDLVAYLIGHGYGNSPVTLRGGGDALSILGMTAETLPKFVGAANAEFSAIQSLFQVGP